MELPTSTTLKDIKHKIRKVTLSATWSLCANICRNTAARPRAGTKECASLLFQFQTVPNIVPRCARHSIALAS